MLQLLLFSIKFTAKRIWFLLSDDLYCYWPSLRDVHESLSTLRVSDMSRLNSQLRFSQCEWCGLVESMFIMYTASAKPSIHASPVYCCVRALALFSVQHSLPASKNATQGIKSCLIVRASCKHDLTDEASPQNTPQILCKTRRDPLTQVRRKQVHNAVVFKIIIY